MMFFWSNKKNDFDVATDETAEANLFNNRIKIAMIVVVLMVIALIVNLYIIQIVQYSSFEKRSNNNRIKIIPIAPPRGLIYDRNGEILADNKPIYEIELIPENLSKNVTLKESLTKLRELLKLSIDDKDIENIIERVKFSKKFKSISVASKLTEDQIAIFSVNQFNFKGFSIEPKLKRFYPFADTVTHALGYVSRINQKDQEILEAQGNAENYAATQDMGKLGVEKFYEDILHGKVGYKEVEVDSIGRVVQTLKKVQPIPGKDIHLTIDIRLQQKAQKLLEGNKGAIIMMDPRNGEILAFASNPTYDPNMFVRGILNKEYQELLNNPERPLINRVSQGGYSPASTIKPIMSVMGLNEGIVTAKTRFFGGPHYSLPGSTHKFRDWRRWGHGWMDIYRAIEISCDTFFYDMAFKSGIDNIHKYMSYFGFGQPSGIDIFEESLANLPSKEWKRNKYHQVWVPGDTVPIGIGQGYWTTTLLQLARAHSILTQHGKNVIPHLAKEYDEFAREEFNIRNPKKQYVEPKETAVSVKSSSYFDIGMKGMYLVVNGPEGTGRKAFSGTKYVAAGKSGTAQIITIKQDQHYNAAAIKKEHRDNALFVAFAPYEKPIAVVGILLENVGGGSRFAAPLARQMLDEYLINLGYLEKEQSAKQSENENKQDDKK